MRNLAKNIAVAALALGSVSWAGAWSQPIQDAPQGNAPGPIDGGATAQAKSGNLGVSGLGVFGRAVVSADPTFVAPLNLKLSVNGAFGAAAYCDQSGQNCEVLGSGIDPIPVDDPKSCRIAVSGVTSEWAHVGCQDTEIMTGGGCRSHGGAYQAHDSPFIGGDGYANGYAVGAVPGKMYWGCASGSTGTYSQAYAVCCSRGGENIPSQESPVSEGELMRCINPSTWTWVC
jgi:hypothetical protein